MSTLTPHQDAAKRGWEEAMQRVRAQVEAGASPLDARVFEAVVGPIMLSYASERDNLEPWDEVTVSICLAIGSALVSLARTIGCKADIGPEAALYAMLGSVHSAVEVAMGTAAVSVPVGPGTQGRA